MFYFVLFTAIKMIAFKTLILNERKFNTCLLLNISNLTRNIENKHGFVHTFTLYATCILSTPSIFTSFQRQNFNKGYFEKTNLIIFAFVYFLLIGYFNHLCYCFKLWCMTIRDMPWKKQLARS